MVAPGEKRWVKANLFSDAAYVEIAPPSAQHQERVLARLKKMGRLLVGVGVVATILLAGPGFVAAAITGAPMPAVYGALIVAVVWVAAVVIWKKVSRWYARRPVRIGLSANDYRRRRQQEQNRKIAGVPRTRIVDGLEYPE